MSGKLWISEFGASQSENMVDAKDAKSVVDDKFVEMHEI